MTEKEETNKQRMEWKKELFSEKCKKVFITVSFDATDTVSWLLVPGWL